MSAMHTHTYSCTCKHHVCTPTHTHMHRSHALCSYMYVCAHTSTHVQSHILCAHMQEFVCTYKHPAHRRACPHVRTRSCTHPPMRWHTCAHPHTHTCLWPRSPSQLQAGCISGAPARAALPGVGLASTSPSRLLREPFCPCLPWTWGSVTGPSPGWQLCPSILRALLFLQNMRLEIPPREACLLSPAGWRGARFTGLLCAPRGKPSSDLISAMGSCGWATSLSLCLGGGLTQLAVEACRRNGWSEGPGDLHPPQPHWMPVGSPVRVAVGGTQQHFTQSQTRPPCPVGPSWLHSVEVLDLRSCLSIPLPSVWQPENLLPPMASVFPSVKWGY